MLPSSFQVPAGVVILLGGVISCFFGYRLFRFVVIFFGFLLGAMIASSIVGAAQLAYLVIAALVGGFIGALIFFSAYFVGVALVGAGAAALLVHATSAQAGLEPHAAVVILMAILGAVVGLALQRYVIIVSTAFGGAWTTIVGSLAVLGDRQAALAATSGDVWVFYPAMQPGQPRWLLAAWILLGLLGCVAQFAWPGKPR